MIASKLDSEQSLKTAFAEAWLRDPDNVFRAARTVFFRRDEVANALYAANNWIYDDFVISERKRLLKEHGEFSFLPNKADVARKIHGLADRSQDPELSLKALKLYCDVRGYIEKPGTTVNTGVVNNKIMVLKDHGDDDNWERGLIEQQQALIESA